MTTGEEVDIAIQRIKKLENKISNIRSREHAYYRRLLKPFFDICFELNVDKKIEYGGLTVSINPYNESALISLTKEIKVKKLFRTIKSIKTISCSIVGPKSGGYGISGNNAASVCFIQNLEGIIKYIISERTEEVEQALDMAESNEEVRNIIK